MPIKRIKYIIFFISQFFYSQTIISFYDVTQYQDENNEYILYNDQKYTGKYLLNSDTVKIITSVKDGLIHSIEESSSNYKSITTLKQEKKYKKIYNKAGELISEGILINDQKNGKWRHYYSDGKIKNVEFYDFDKKIGKWKYYDPKGIVLKTISFKGEVPIPSSKEINKDILSIERLTLKKQNCKQNLDDISFKRSDFNCEFIYYYNNSKYTGYATSFDEKIFFIDQGKAVFVKVLIGKRISEFFYVDDKLERNGNYLEFLSNEKIKVRGNYKNGDKSGDWIEYYDSGRIKLKKRYYFNEPKDWWFYYSESGDNTKIEIYSNGKLETIGKPFYEARNSKYFDINTVFYDAITNKALYQRKERHFIKNGYVYPLEYKEL